eukprot:PRCOL_00002938-RA
MIYDINSPLFKSYLTVGGVKTKKAETGAPEPKTKAKDNKPVFND